MAQEGKTTNYLEENVDLYDFLDSSIPHDRVLVVEDKKFYVLSGILSLTSEFFNTMFNGSFREKNETEIVLPDVAAVDFQNFLNVIYPAEFNVDETNLGGLMKVSGSFFCPIVWQKCKKYLESEENFLKFEMLDLLEWSENCNCEDLKDEVLDRMTQLLNWYPSEYFVHCVDLANDLPKFIFYKMAVNDYVTSVVDAFDEQGEIDILEGPSSEDCWLPFQKTLVELHKQNKFADKAELKTLLRLAKHYNFTDLEALIVNELSDQFLHDYNFKNIEIAVDHDLKTLMALMEDYLKNNVGSIPEKTQDILFNVSSKVYKFVMKSVFKHECEDKEN